VVPLTDNAVSAAATLNSGELYLTAQVEFSFCMAGLRQLSWIEHGSSVTVLESNARRSPLAVATLCERLGFDTIDLGGISSHMEFDALMTAERLTIFSGLREPTPPFAFNFWHSGGAGFEFRRSRHL